MKTITIHSLQAILPMMLLPGILFSAEPERKNTAPPPGTTGVPGRPSRYANDPPPTKKIVYKKVGGWELALHIFEPAGQQPAAKRPAIIFFHGGAWAIGDANQFYYQCDYLAKRGLWAASADYRLTSPGAGIRIADIVLDAKDAIRYVRSHAGELGIDPDRIAAGGGSAGGHLAAATAVAPEENPPGAVSGRANLLVLFNPALFYPSAGKTVTLEQFTKHTPPAILFYGTKDEMLQYGKDCLAQARRLGFTLRLMTAKDAGHSFFNDQPWRDRTLYESDRFLAEHGYLQGPPTVEPRAGKWQLDEIKDPGLIGTEAGIPSPAAAADKPAVQTQPPATAPEVSPEQGRVLEGHKGSVEALDFSADEKTLVSCSRDSTIKFWNWQTGELLRTLDAHASDVIDVQFSPHGDLIASCSRDKTIKLWDARTFKLVRTLEGHTDLVRAVAFSPDQKTLASSAVDKTVRLWDVESGELKKTMTGHLGRVKSIVFSPDGKWLATGGDHSPKEGPDGESIRIWDARTGQQIGELQGLDHSGIETISLSPDGTLLAGSCHDTFVRIWDVQTRTMLHKLAGHTLEVDACSFLPDGRTLVSGCKDKTIKFWDVKTGQLLKTLTGHTGRVESLCVSPHGKTLVTGGGGGETVIRVWDISKIR